MNAQSFIWSRIFLIGLVSSCAVLTVAGVAARYFDLPPSWGLSVDLLNDICALAFAGIAGFSLGVSQMAAAMAVTLKNEKRSGMLCPFNLAVFSAAVCGLISLGGVHLGAVQLGLDWRVLDLGGLALVAVKPIMSFVTEEARAISRRKVQEIKDRDEERFWKDRADSRALEQKRLGETGPQSPQDGATGASPEKVVRLQPKRSTAARKAAGVLMAAAAATSGAAAPAAAFPTEQAPVTAQARTVNRPTQADIERAVEALKARGVEAPGSRSIAAYLGCSRHQVRLALGA